MFILGFLLWNQQTSFCLFVLRLVVVVEDHF